MAYQVLARKWRPQNFSALVGQEPIVTALRNALAEGRIAHAYLFSGIRGVGKTTAARVLAKALNCERGPAPDPCNECAACLEITRGSDLDVLEVDAATYSKVEQVRELTESLRYGPARDRYKVVVLDEVHRLSRQAFDALLKIVEEPPPRLVFIFATTEIEAVPATILSRCQEFQFRRVSAAAVATLLRQICDAESIQASASALRLVARAGEGSVRDAVALLDQLATFGSGTVADEAAVRLLGGLDTALFRRVLEAMLAGDAGDVSRAVRYIEDEGWDPRHVYGQFLAYGRDALHLALGADPGAVDLASEEATPLAELARAAGYENLLRLLNQLLASEPQVRRSETGALAVEIAWLRAAELPKLTRVEELLAGGAPAARASLPPAGRAPQPAPASSASALAAGRASAPIGFSSAAAAGAAAASQAPDPETQPPPLSAPPGRSGTAPSDAVSRTGDPRPPAGAISPVEHSPEGRAATAAAAAAPQTANARPAAGATPAIERPPAPASQAARPPGHGAPPAAPPSRTGSAIPAATPGPAAPESRTATAAAAAPGSGDIQAFLHEVSARKQPLAAHLEQAAAIRFEDGRLLIMVPPGEAYLSSRLRQQSNRDALAEAVAKVWGTGVPWDFAEGPLPAAAPRTAAGGRDAAAPPGDEPPPDNLALTNPAVQTLLDIFGGRIEAVEERPGLREE
jgi:DNA polymerase-3 subunit gamma/tau